MRVISAAALLFFKAALSSLGQFDTKPKQTQQLAPPNGGFLGEHTKEVSGGVFEKRQIRFKLTAIVIQVEVSLHILATIAASSSLQSNSYFVLGDIYAASAADVQCTQRQTLLSSKVKRMTPRTSSFALLDPKSSEVNGVVFELLPSIRLLPNFDGSLPQFVPDNGSVWTFGGHLKICTSQ